MIISSMINMRNDMAGIRHFSHGLFISNVSRNDILTDSINIGYCCLLSMCFVARVKIENIIDVIAARYFICEK